MVSEIFTVSEFTKKIKLLLEESYPFIWIKGEISNCFTPVSNHSYFSLKDEDGSAVISCVVFSGQKNKIKFDLENGLRITGMARLSLYEPKGTYQLIFEHIEPAGAGSLQIAFEQLKKRLDKKGLFDEKFKKPIPFLPLKLSIITSPTGAAVRDILNILTRRFYNLLIDIIPVTVQGKNSDKEISHAIELANRINRSQLIIIARGGGSFEDLSSFNSEIVANAIFNSEIPVISGIGHETDFTIADFVSDLRAPTPSAAAELALPEKKLLKETLEKLHSALNKGINNRIESLGDTIESLKKRLKSPGQIIDDMRIRLDDNNFRLDNAVRQIIRTKKAEINGKFEKLIALNPEAVLQRGYSITRIYGENRIIMDSAMVNNCDLIETVLYKGSVISRVETIRGGEKNAKKKEI